MSKPNVMQQNLGNGLNKYYRDDLPQVVQTFRQFAHFSQFADVSRHTTKIPVGTNKTMSSEVRIDSSPDVYPGELLFGVNLDGSLVWLAEIIDSRD